MSRSQSSRSYSHNGSQCASHKYQQLPLIPVEDFLLQHPEHADDDENVLMGARIDHERGEREALEQQRQELLKRKQKLIADNKRRKDDLANLDKDLEKFIDVRISCCYLLSNGLLMSFHRRRSLSLSCSTRRHEPFRGADRRYGATINWNEVGFCAASYAYACWTGPHGEADRVASNSRGLRGVRYAEAN